VASGAFPNNGGGEAAAQDDFGFYSVAGQLEGDPATLKLEDFWDLGPLNRALAKLGTN
jgi:NitT/TauT family transport system substrate-binding protein